MERIEAFRPGTESIDDWLEMFEARAEAMKVRVDREKISWTKSQIGKAGRRIVSGMGPGSGWEAVKNELRAHFTEETGQTAAWRQLRQFDGTGKTLGEIAAEITGLVRQAATEEAVQEKLAIDTFLEAIPWAHAKEMKKSKLPNMKEALERARYMAAVDREDERRRGIARYGLKNVTVEEERDESPDRIRVTQERDRRPGGSGEEMSRPQFGSQEARRRFGNQFRDDRMDRPQFGSQEARRGYRDRAERWNSQRRTSVICWSCDEPGHVSRNCPAFQEFLASRRGQGHNLAPKEQRDGARNRDEWALN